MATIQRRAEFIDPRSEFVDPTDFVPVLGTLSRAKRIIKSTNRSYKWFKRKRVPRVKRVVASGLVGSHQMLRAQRIFPYGAALHVLHSGGRSAVQAARAGKGAKGSAKAFKAGGYAAAQTSVMGAKQGLKPVLDFGKGARRTYRMLGDAPTVKKVVAAHSVGARQTLKGTKALKKFYGYDKRGRRIVRSIQHKGRKLKRRFRRKGPTQ